MVTMNIGKNATIDVDLSQLPGTVRDWCVHNWVRLTLERSHASVTAETEPDESKRTEAAKAAAAKRWESMLAGNIRATTTRETDPVKVELKALARKAADAELRKHKLDPKKVSQDAWDKLVARHMARPELVAQAEAAAAILAGESEALPDDLAALLGIGEEPVASPAEIVPAEKVRKRK